MAVAVFLIKVRKRVLSCELCLLRLLACLIRFFEPAVLAKLNPKKFKKTGDYTAINEQCKVAVVS